MLSIENFINELIFLASFITFDLLNVQLNVGHAAGDKLNAVELIVQVIKVFHVI